MLRPWMIVAAGLLAVSALAGERRIVLTEYLGQQWRNQLVSFAFEAPEGSCHPRGVSLEGPDGPVPVQLHDIAYWPDGATVKTATVSFLADLPARVQREYRLRWQDDPVWQADSDLRVNRGEGMVELRTSRFGARLRVGERNWQGGAAATDVPPPVQALMLADGTWFGAAAMYGDLPVNSASARLVADGPVFAEVACTYVYADGNRMDLRARLVAGDNALRLDSKVRQDAPKNGWQLDLDVGLGELLFPVQLENQSTRECYLSGRRHPFRWHQPVRDLCVLGLAEHEPGLICSVTPWQDWWTDYTKRYLWLWLPETSQRLLICRLDPGVWIEPTAAGAMRDWGETTGKHLPLVKTADGHVRLQVNLAAGEVGGRRRFAIGAAPMPPEVAEAENIRELLDGRILRQGEPCPRVGDRLNEIKDYALDWPADPARPHPCLLLDQAEIEATRARIELPEEFLEKVRGQLEAPVGKLPERLDTEILAAWLLTGDDAYAIQGNLVERLKTRLGLLGGFDKMRHTMSVMLLYDALIDSHLVKPDERELLRAQMAYLAYQLESPHNWSVERGYRSGNPNMNINHLTNQGTMAALLRDHPRSDAWARTPCAWLQTWLTDDIGPKGEWRESHHYVHVSFDAVMTFVVAAKKAGIRDYFAASDLDKLCLYLAKMVYTPPDPLRENRRVTAPMGRRPNGTHHALLGFAARATAESDPEFSRHMQFVWQGTGCSRAVSNAVWGGFEYIYADPTLPAERPDWGSEYFPWWGVVLRQGYGSEHEHYVNMILGQGPVWSLPSAHGSVVKFFSMGVPIGGTYAGHYKMKPNIAPRQELLQNRVIPARDWTNEKDYYEAYGHPCEVRQLALAFLPPADYVRADLTMREAVHLWAHSQPKRVADDLPKWPKVERPGKVPIDWTRQLLYVKAADPAQPGYLVFRDTVLTDQPTSWQFSTLSEKLGTPAEAADRAAFLAAKPGAKILPFRPLEGNRFTAVGQFGVDTEYYVAAPLQGERYTMRYGSGTPHPSGLKEFQDMLMLRREDAGDYFVVLYPHRAGTPAPEFSTLADGHVVKVATADRSAWTFLALEPVAAAVAADQVSFQGTAANVEVTAERVALSLAAAGRVAWGPWSLAADHAVAMVVTGDRAVVTLPPGREDAAIITLGLDGAWRPDAAAKGVKWEGANGGGRLQIPAAIEAVRLRRR